MSISGERASFFKKPHASPRQNGVAQRLSHWREVQWARHALQLAGEPLVVLDRPRGAGCFWPVFCEKPGQMMFAADNFHDMFATARATQAPERMARVGVFQASAFAIGLDADAVDCVLCIRPPLHVETAGRRLAVLREFNRLNRDTAIVSAWSDGNDEAWKRHRLERRRAAKRRMARKRKRFVVGKPVIEKGFPQAGSRALGGLDSLPGPAMWPSACCAKSPESWMTR